jgi:hypothetical protein
VARTKHESDDCTRPGDRDGLVLEWPSDAQRIDGFDWTTPATPVVTAVGGVRQITLGFHQELGRDYMVFRVVNGVVEPTPLVNVRGGDGDEEPTSGLSNIVTASRAAFQTIQTISAPPVKGGYKLVKTLTAKTKTFTDKTGKASKTATAKVKKK